MNNKESEKIAILDCGGQYTKVIDRKVRELGVKSEILPIEVTAEKLKEYKALILSGGPSGIYTKNAPKYDKNIFGLGIPVFGICYGFNLINQHFGGVNAEMKSEYTQQDKIDINNSCELFTGLDKTEIVFMNYDSIVKEIADGFECVAKKGDVIAAIYNKEKKISAVQFYPEVELTVKGIKIFENFLRKICGLQEVYALEDRIQTSVDMIREKVGNSNVIVFVSGGVDSMVTSALLLKALPAENIYAIHVDHGFMRKNESDSICEKLKKIGFKNLLRINAQDEFLYSRAEINDGEFSEPLCDVSDPEQKRNIIGRLFVEVARKAADSFGLDFSKTFIAQGTLRPDLIESGNPDVSGYANKIKTHHNDVDIIRKARKQGLVVETNWDWHKDEVRQVARMLELDEETASRQPFPGPGLAVRMICYPQKTQAAVTTASSIDVFPVETAKLRAVHAVQAPILSVGVEGDARSYKRLCVIYGEIIDAEQGFEEIAKISSHITNNMEEINRCVYVIDGEYKQGELKCADLAMSKENADLIREIDYIVTSNIAKETNKISQCFGVLLPISAAGNKYSAVIRAVITTDFMTARAAVIGKDISFETIKNIANEIKSQLSEIDLVLYDVTNKPPSTVEWE